MNIIYLLYIPGPWQWIIIGIAILLLFGGKKIPELMRGLGSGIKEFKDASSEGEIDESSSKKESKKDEKDTNKDN